MSVCCPKCEKELTIAETIFRGVVTYYYCTNCREHIPGDKIRIVKDEKRKGINNVSLL